MGGLEVVQRWPSSAAQTWAESFVTEVRSDANVAAIVAVGSAIRDVPFSADLDFVVVYVSARPDMLARPIDVDVRAYRRDEVDGLLEAGHDYLGWSLRLGQIVHERDGYWRKLQQRWGGRLPWPSSSAAEERASRAERLKRELEEMGDTDAAAEQLVAMLTHLARARLLDASIFPASRPELVQQLRGIGETGLADRLASTLEDRRTSYQTPPTAVRPAAG